MARHNEVGVKGEIIALEFLEWKGYAIQEINWRFKHCEVDIIAKHNNTLVFVEVKTRNTDFFGEPEAAVDKEKQKKMAEAATEYIESNNLDIDVRFDIVSIVMRDGKPDIHHIEDAFFPYDL
jgi:putative endonuclease